MAQVLGCDNLNRSTRVGVCTLSLQLLRGATLVADGPKESYVGMEIEDCFFKQTYFRSLSALIAIGEQGSIPAVRDSGISTGSNRNR